MTVSSSSDEEFDTKQLPYVSLFSRYKFSCFFERSFSWVLFFVGVIFCGYESCAHGFVYFAVRVITSFITSIRRYGRLVT